MGDGARACARSRMAHQPGPAGQRADADDASSMRCSTRVPSGFKIHEDYGAYPELIDASWHTPSSTTSRRAAHRRPERFLRARGHGRGHRRPDHPRLSRRGRGWRARARRDRPRARGQHHLLVDHADDPVRRQRGRRAPADDRRSARRLSRADPGDLELARERVRAGDDGGRGPAARAGRDRIINSDSQGMGRIGETIRRTLQLAHVMKAWRAGPGGAGGRTPRRCAVRAAARGVAGRRRLGPDDNERVLRYLAKCTIEPAITHGIPARSASLEPGRLADIVLWRPGYFGVKPELVFKSGHFAWGVYGEGNASVEGAEPRRYGAALGRQRAGSGGVSVTFVSRAAAESGRAARLGSWTPAGAGFRYPVGAPRAPGRGPVLPAGAGRPGRRYGPTGRPRAGRPARSPRSRCPVATC